MIIVLIIVVFFIIYIGVNVRDLLYLRGLMLVYVNVDDLFFIVDILIGVDYYWDVVGNEVIKGLGFIVVKLKIGYFFLGFFFKSNYLESFNSFILSVVIEY